MKLEYLVTENDYISLLAGMIRKNDHRPIKQILFFMLTAGQMAIIAYMCATRLEPSRWPFYIGWSIAVAALNILHRNTVRARAKGTLYRIKAAEQLPEDYWQTHKLKENSDGLLLSYGDIKILCPTGELSRVEEEDGLIYLYAGSNMFDIVPVSVFKTAEDKRTFLNWMQSFQLREPEALTSTEKPKWDSTSEIKLSYSMAGDEFILAQVSAFRALYLRYQFGKGASLIKIALSVFVVVNFVMALSTINALLSAVLIFALNYKNLTVLTPLGATRIRRELGAWQHGGEITLSIGERGIWYRCGEELILVPYDSIDADELVKYYRFFSWGRFPAVVIPLNVAKSSSGKVFLDALAEMKSMK